MVVSVIGQRSDTSTTSSMFVPVAGRVAQFADHPLIRFSHTVASMPSAKHIEKINGGCYSGPPSRFRLAPRRCANSRRDMPRRIGPMVYLGEVLCECQALSLPGILFCRSFSEIFALKRSRGRRFRAATADMVWSLRAKPYRCESSEAVSDARYWPASDCAATGPVAGSTERTNEPASSPPSR